VILLLIQLIAWIICHYVDGLCHRINRCSNSLNIQDKLKVYCFFVVRRDERVDSTIRKLCGWSMSRVNYVRACSSTTTTTTSSFLRHPPVAHNALYPRLLTLLFVRHASDASAWSAWLASHIRCRFIVCTNIMQRARL